MEAILCVAVVLLGVGIALGLILAALFRAVGGASSQPGRRPPERCPRCGATPYHAQAPCRACRFDARMAAHATSLDELAATRRQLDLMVQSEAIGRSEWARLTRIVRNEQERIAAGAEGRPFEAPLKVEAPVTRPAATARSDVWQPVQRTAKPQATVAARARSSAEVRNEATSESLRTVVPVEARVEVAPAGPQRTLADLLQAFMEEKNIRWGEVVSGMLIVISSVGLVISLWSTLTEAIPYFPALLFMLITLAIHGAGLYTLRRWKLQSTSRGLLIISALLVPLNFLAAIALSEFEQQPRAVSDPWYIAAVVVGLVSYGWISYSSARTMLRRPWWPLFVSVMGASASQIVLSRITESGLGTWALNLRALLPLVPFLAGTGGQLAVAAAGRRLSEARVTRTFLLLGLALFSLVLALALLAWKSGAIVSTLADISPCLNLAAVMITAIGVVVHQRAERPEMATARTSGTFTALLGMGLVVAALALAWPRPELMLAIGVVDCVALTAMAVLAGIPALHAGAAAALGLVVVLTLHLVQGTVSIAARPTGQELLAVLLMGRSGLALMFYCGALVLTARFLMQRGRRDDGRMYLWSMVGLSAVAVLIGCHSGFWSGRDGELATVILGAYAAIVMWLAPRAQHVGVTWGGSGLAMLALLHGLLRNDVLLGWLAQASISLHHPWVVAALLHATWMSAAAVWLGRRTANPGSTSENDPLFSAVVMPLSVAAMLTSVAALPGIVFVRGGFFVTHACYALWAAIVWGVAAAFWRSRFVMTAAQALSTLGVSFAVVAACRETSWWRGLYYDPRYVQAQLGALAVWSLVWLGVRRLPNARLRQLLRPYRLRFTFDRVLLGLSLRGMVALALAGALPGIAAELSRIPGATGALRVSPESASLWVVIVLLSLGVAGTAVWSAFQRRISAGVLGGLAVVTLGVAAAVLGFAPPGAAGLHVHAHGPGSWIVFGMVIVGLLLSLRERVTPSRLSGLLLALLVALLLVAGQLESQVAAASTLRWGLALFAMLIAAAVTVRSPLALVAQRAGFHCPPEQSAESVDVTRGLALGISTLPLLGLTLWFLFAEYDARRLLGPAADSLFDQLGPLWTYAGPIAVLGVASVMFALRDRLPLHAIGGSLLVQLLACVGCALFRWTDGLPLGTSDMARLVVWNGLALGVYSAGWLFARRWSDLRAPGRSAEPSTAPSALDLQLMWTFAVVSVPLVWTTAAVVAWPGRIPPVIEIFGGPATYISLFVGTLAYAWHRRDDMANSAIMFALSLPFALVILMSATLSHWSTAENWLAYRAMASGLCLLAVASTIAVCRLTRPGNEAYSAAADPLVSWSVFLAVVVVALALRGLPSDPVRPWWSVGWTAALAACSATIALRLRGYDFAYTSVLLTMLSTSCAWATPWLGLGESATPQSVVELIEAVVIAAALAGTGWLVVDVYWQSRWGKPLDARSGVLPVHHTLSVAGRYTFAVIAGVCLALRTDAIAHGRTPPADISNPGGWIVLGCLAVLSCGLLWDRTARRVVGGLHALGLVALIVLLDDLHLAPRMLRFAAGLATAGYAHFTGLLATQGARLRSFSERCAMAPVPAGSGTAWLILPNLILVAAASVIAVRVVLLYPETHLRLWGTFAAALLVPAVVCLGRDAHRERYQTLALVLGGLAAVDFGWAVMRVDDDPHYWLQRSIRLMESLAVTTFLYGVGLARILDKATAWFRAARNAATIAGGAALVSLLVVLVMEGLWFDRIQGAPVTPAQIAVVAATLVGLAAALISLAVLPRRDPLNLSLEGRMLYVYGAEIVLSLLFVHIRLTLPELFHGYMLPYWPFIVMAIAFAEVGLGEMFTRMEFRVLSEPLRRTGAFLPLLPALGYWIHIEQAGRDVIAGEYSSVLVFVGLLYVVLAMWRRSFLYGTLAAVAGNGALWALLHEQGIEILAHPQMWLIPPALSVLGAAHINRDRLSEAQLTAIRYLSVTVIYVSSTGEMLLQGIGEHLWLPIVLAMLSLCGIFAGILLHVRAFLYLGTSFLLLSLVSMVWHAARSIGHVWPWWAFGIATGLAILALFGVFEKKRNEVLHLVHGLREWEG